MESGNLNPDDAQDPGESLGPLHQVPDGGGAHGWSAPQAWMALRRSDRCRVHTSRSAGPAETGTLSNRNRARSTWARGPRRSLGSGAARMVGAMPPPIRASWPARARRVEKTSPRAAASSWFAAASMWTQATVTVSRPAAGWIAWVEGFWSVMTWLLSVG